MTPEDRITLAHHAALHRAFREQAWLPQGTSLEPELDWHTDQTATQSGYVRRWH